MAVNDHIVSFTLSVVLHFLGLLLLGFIVLRLHTKETQTEVVLDIAPVELTLSKEENNMPGTTAAAQNADESLPTLQVPQPAQAVPEPQPTEKPDFLDALPEPVPEPPPPEPAPKPEPKPVLNPEPKPEPKPPVVQPTPQPVPKPPPAPAAPSPAQQTAPATSPKTTALPSVDSVGGNEGRGASSGRIDGHPSLERTIRPSYPIGARRRGEEGTVILDVLVSAKGRAARVTLVSSSGFPELDNAALQAAAKAHFKPGTRNGRPIESAARLTLIFRLRDN